MQNGTVLDRPFKVRFKQFYADARRDPYFPASTFGAAWFVLINWRWLNDREFGPYTPVLNPTGRQASPVALAALKKSIGIIREDY